jgi:hypothetical protein
VRPCCKLVNWKVPLETSEMKTSDQRRAAVKSVAVPARLCRIQLVLLRGRDKFKTFTQEHGHTQLIFSCLLIWAELVHLSAFFPARAYDIICTSAHRHNVSLFCTSSFPTFTDTPSPPPLEILGTDSPSDLASTEPQPATEPTLGDSDTLTPSQVRSSKCG